MSLTGRYVETLLDIEDVLGQLRISMDTAFVRRDEMAYYREHHRKVRLISELMFFTVKELNNHFTKTQKIGCNLFCEINEENKKAKQSL